MFVNTLVLRCDLAGDPAFTELLARVRETAVGAYAHQELPFEKLVEELRPERSLGHSPLFQVLFILQNAPPAPIAGGGDLEIRPLSDVYHGVSRFDLTLSLTEIATGIGGYLEYKTDLIDAATAERWIGHLGNLLAAAAAAPEERISALPLLAAAERDQLLVAWNDTALEVPAAPVHRLFEAQAERTPDAVAARFAGAALTYGELNARANRLARRLRGRGGGPRGPGGDRARAVARPAGRRAGRPQGGRRLPAARSRLPAPSAWS